MRRVLADAHFIMLDGSVRQNTCLAKCVLYAALYSYFRFNYICMRVCRYIYYSTFLSH